MPVSGERRSSVGVSHYRCQGCREYRQRPEFSRLGLGSVCSQACALAAANRLTIGRSSAPVMKPVLKQRPAKADIPLAVRLEVGVRDRGRCRVCGIKRRLHLHHVQLRAQGGLHVPQNLVTLCLDDHALVHTDTPYYQPILRALIWLDYVEGRHLDLNQTIRFLQKAA